MNNDLKVVAFKLGNEEYAFDIQQVLSIEKMQPITPFPRSPEHIKGMIDLRGEIIPVIDLRTVLSKESFTESANTRIILVKVNEKGMGIIVDEATDVIDLPADAIHEPPTAVITDGSIIKGIVKLDKRLLVLLNSQAILEEFHILEQLSTLSL